MFRWLKRLFWRGFDPGEAEVYRYLDGRRRVRGDPMAILRRLSMDDNFDLTREMILSANKGKIGLQAYDRLMSGTRAAFEIPACRDGGLTDTQCAALLADFMEWVQKKSESMPSSPDSAPAIQDSQDDQPPEPSNSDCSSTTAEPSPNKLSPSLPQSMP